MRTFSVTLLAALSYATTSAPVVAQGRSNPDEYRNRDGEKEAMADLQQGRALKLYYSWQWGERLMLPAAGIQFCYADGPKDIQKAKTVFVPIPALEYAEGHLYTPEENERGLSAWNFAAYNLTMWRHKKSEISRLCPGASLAD